MAWEAIVTQPDFRFFQQLKFFANSILQFLLGQFIAHQLSELNKSRLRQQNHCEMKPILTPRNQRKFQTRYEQSFEMTARSSLENSFNESMLSTIIDAQQIGSVIAELLVEQKRKFLTRKTENQYLRKQLNRMKKSQLIRPLPKQFSTIPPQICSIICSEKPCPDLPQNDLEDAVYGAFFGYVIGDSVGAYMALQTQDLSSFIPSALLMNGGGTFNLASGQGTDETEIMLTTAYGLIQCKKTYSQNIMALNYLKWLESKPFDLPVLMALSFNDIRKAKNEYKRINQNTIGHELKSASRKNEKHQSNLGLIRVLPLVVWGMKFSEQDFEQFIADEMSLICPNSLVKETTVLYAKVLRTIFKERDHEKAFYEASKWVYSHGSEKLFLLWSYVERALDVPGSTNMGKLKTSFTYSMAEIQKKHVSFVESLISTLEKGGECDSNCAIVMALVGAVVGYNSIPSYFKHRIMNSQMKETPIQRTEDFLTSKVCEVVPQLLQNCPQKYLKRD